MHQFLRFFFSLFILVAILCGCGCNKEKSFRIGIDSTWSSLDFGLQQNYVNGFIEELLMEVARYSGMKIERVEANWDNLLDGLREKRYDAILTSLPRYNFNVAKYDFSQNILDLGPVLILPKGSKAKSLKDLSGELVAVVSGDDSALVLQKYPDILMRSYFSAPEMLDALENGDVEGALLDRLSASSFVRDLYSNKLKLVGLPLTQKGIHLTVLKGHEKHRLDSFEKSISHLEKKTRMQKLLAKWQLD